jgi:nitrite reductase/ring-hydroxylating ferredoxin subunit
MTMEKVCKTSDVPNATMKGFTLNGRQILIANVDGIFYAVDALCPHMNGYLPSGKLEKSEVVCPVHRARYDVTTGKLVKNIDGLVNQVTRLGAKDLTKYKVQVETDNILVDA